MSGERQSLAEAFQPARGRSLEGLLAPKRKKESLADELGEMVADAKPLAPEPDVNKQVDSGNTHSKREAAVSNAAPRSQTVPGAPRNVGVYLPPELLVEVKSRARVEQITYSDLLVDAFEAIDPAELTLEFAQPAEQSTSGMPRRVRRIRGTAGIQIQLRLDDRQIQWLDEQVTVHSASSRSALVSTAFRLYLSS